MRIQSRLALLISLFSFLPVITINSVGRARAPGISGIDLFSHTGASASPDPRRHDRALQQWRRLPRAGQFASAAVGSITGTVWKPVGPSPIVEDGCCVSPTVTFAANGRVNSIAVDPTNSDVLYLGSAGGGVWKSVDRGGHWNPMTDQEISLGIGSSHALAVDPNHPNTIYAGTSSFALLDQSLPRPMDSAQSRGILKSTDGGASWILLGSGIPTGNDGNAASLFFGRNITTIIVDPANSNVLYLAAGRGGDPNPGGVFRSTDGGLNWTQGTGTVNMLVESLVLDTSSPPGSRVLYAGASDQGVLKSTDGGQGWTGVLTATTPAVAAGYVPFHKVMVALAPPASPPLLAGPVVYVSLMQNDFLSAVIFENTNGGSAADWVKKNGQVLIHSSSDFANLSGGGFSDMVVDPASPGDGVNDLIYWGGLTQYLSTDSAGTFNEIGQIHGIHGDHQTWLVVPHAGTNTVYAGDDGGIWRSEDAGGTWTGTSLTSLGSTINSGGLQIATLYQLTVKQDATAGVTIGGAQDSGILRTTGGATWSGTSNDGIDVAFDKVDKGVAYAIGNTAFLKSTDSGATWPIDFTAKLPALQIGIFQNRFAVDPNNAGFLYVGGSGKFPPLPATQTPGDVLQTRNGTTSFRSLGLAAPWYISSLDVAPGDSNRLVVASQNQVFVTTNALAPTVGPPSGVMFQDITGDLPGRFVTRVAFDPNDASVVYATLAGFGGGHVFRKTITMANWTDISPAVNIPVNAIALDGGSNPAILYIGTDLGVLRRSVADGAAWEVVDDLHLPNAAVSDLEINTQAGVFRAATWGRGVFELAAPSGPVISVAETSLPFGPTCAVTGADQSIHVSSVGTDNLVVSSVQRISGSPSFTVLPSPSTPLVIAPGGGATFTVHYTPTIPGMTESAIIRISSNDPAVPFVDLVARGNLEATPPTITCPANMTVVSAVACPPTSSTAVTFPTPTASDNCPGVTVACNPPSGSPLPVGTSAVTCTATDTAGLTASCTFSVTVFNGRLQDDSNPKNVLLFNTTTGDYSLCCGGMVFTGKGTVILRGCTFALQHNPSDRRLQVNVDFSQKKGTASLQFPPGSLKCTITDRNMADDTSTCP
jgi:HYR domain